MRAFRLARMPSQGLAAVGSFDSWSRKVRDLVFWLTDHDVAEAFRRNKAEDPRRQGDASLLAALHQRFENKWFKGAEVMEVYKRVADLKRTALGQPAPPVHALQAEQAFQAEQALHNALDDVLGSRNVNAKVFGHWARGMNGVHNSGFILESRHDAATNANVIAVRRTQ
jgi:hypothetical protein